MSNDESRLWSIPDWCAAANLSRGWFYATPAEFKPYHVKLGRSVRITETPKEFGQRIARLRAASTEEAAR
jgi:hypothetical protein